MTAITRIGSTIYLGGEFSQVGGAARQGLAAIDAATGNVLPWNPGLPPSGRTPRVRCMTASPTTVYITGEFAQVGGVTRVVLAAIDAASGAVKPWDARYAAGLIRPSSQGIVHAIAWTSLGLVVAGDFSAIGGATRSGFAILNDRTGDATAWNYIQGNDVRAVVLHANLVYVGGQFVLYNNLGQPVRRNLAAINLVSGAAAAFNPNPAGTLDPDSGTPAGRIDSLKVAASKVFVDGNFTQIGGQARSGSAVLDPVSGSALTYAPQTGGDFTYGYTETSDAIIAGSMQTRSGQVVSYGLHALDRTTGQALNWAPTVDGEVSVIGVHGKAIFVGGAFTKVNNQGRQGLAWFGPLPPPGPTPTPVAGVGTVLINVEPATARWSLVDSKHKTRTGTGPATLMGVPSGTVMITWVAMAGYETPSPATMQDTLTNGGQVQFLAIHLPQAAGYRRIHAQLLRYMLGLPAYTAGCDLNGDGKINVVDLMRCMQLE